MTPGDDERPAGESPPEGREDDPPTVLVIEDEENVAEAYTLWLSEEYEVRAELGGEEGIAAVDGDVDVVLLDRRMPGMSGDEVLERIREGEHDPRVAMVTAVDPDFEIVELPFDAYLTKPVTREELTEAVERLLTLKEYGETFREHYALSQKRASLAKNMTRRQLAENEEYQRLADRLEELRRELDETVAGADEDLFAALFGDLEE